MNALMPYIQTHPNLVAMGVLAVAFILICAALLYQMGEETSQQIATKLDPTPRPESPYESAFKELRDNTSIAEPSRAQEKEWAAQSALYYEEEEKCQRRRHLQGKGGSRQFIGGARA